MYITKVLDKYYKQKITLTTHKQTQIRAINKLKAYNNIFCKKLWRVKTFIIF